MNPKLFGILLIAIGAMLALLNRRSANDLIRNRQAAPWARVPLQVFYVALGVFCMLAGIGLVIGWLPA